MMQQERGIELTSVQRLKRPLGATDLAVEVEIARKCRPRGGILADQVGYGKTACMIALINQTVTNGLKAHALLPEEMKMFRNGTSSRSGRARFGSSPTRTWQWCRSTICPP